MSNQQIILLATERPQAATAFEKALTDCDGLSLIHVDTAESLLDMAVRTVPALAVIDQEVNGVDGLEIVRRLLQVNAFIHTAVLTDMAEEVFHEMSEGLGILSAMPTAPDAQQVRHLIERFRQLASDTAG